MKIMDLDSAIDILVTYRFMANGKAEYLKDVIDEMKAVYDEMDENSRDEATLTILPWD